LSVHPDELEQFLEPLRQPEIPRWIARHSGLSVPDAERNLANVLAEAHVALDLLNWAGPRLGVRVLEVGAGAGLFSAFLVSLGVELVAIEPVTEGFGFMTALQQAARNVLPAVPELLPIPASELRSEIHGTFQLVLSVNVIEHFQPFAANFAGLARVLAPEGVSVHTCPNYTFPYEPHYGIALVPFFPRLTPLLAGRRIAKEATWRSLNFVTARQLRKQARQHGLSIAFRPGTMADAVQRLESDRQFASRHEGVATRLAAAMLGLGFGSALRHLPTSVASPMTFQLFYREPAEALARQLRPSR
jgi:SAM-dependent methyltransferase